jgi:hypothetical protein
MIEEVELTLCEICETNDRSHPESTMCDSCRRDFKESER